jgi:hypothetical protein
MAQTSSSNGQGTVTPRPGVSFDGIKIFSATMMAAREQLGENVTAWIAENPQVMVTEFVVTQSSDSQFHCISICVFYRQHQVHVDNARSKRRTAGAARSAGQ